VSATPLRVLHFSDVHVQEPVLSAPGRDLLGKRLLAGLNRWLARGKYFADVPEKMRKLADFAAEAQVSLALCTGDYTAMGTRAEHEQARRMVEPLRAAAPFGLVTVPGNHDQYLPDTIAEKRFERSFGDLLCSDLPAYAVDGPFPFVRLFGDALAVVGVNSARPNPNPLLSSGCVPEAQLASLDKLLDDPRLGARWVIVMTHYGILRRDGRPDAPRHGLDNAEALLRICARPRVVLVHGHIHHRYSHPATASRPSLFCAGSATHRGREGFWLYEATPETFRATPGFWAETHYQLRSDAMVVLDASAPPQR
jgi:3',5'-cyclic AMP phosphodiesterase CpdA